MKTLIKYIMIIFMVIIISNCYNTNHELIVDLERDYKCIQGKIHVKIAERYYCFNIDHIMSYKLINDYIEIRLLQYQYIIYLTCKNHLDLYYRMNKDIITHRKEIFKTAYE